MIRGRFSSRCAWGFEVSRQRGTRRPLYWWSESYAKENVMRASLVAIFAVLTVTSLSAHIMVSPPQSKTGATQKYELRVHNEGKLSVKSVELEIPDGVTVTDVAKPAAGTFTTAKAGTRITSITWTVEVAPTKYLALPFTAKTPTSAGDVKWNVHEHLVDGSIVEWTDKPGAQEKNSVTKLTPAAPVASAPK